MLEFGVLGPLIALRDAEPVALTRPLERRLLAILLARRGRVISDEVLVSALWPHDPPAKPTAALQTSVSRLRKILGEPEVIVREAGIEITNGRSVIASIPNTEEGNFDLPTLSDYMVQLKTEYPGHDAASVLMEARIPYDYLIQVMDIVRSVQVPIEGQEEEYELVALFSEISVGDAP